MAHYWTQEVEKLSACTAATETVHQSDENCAAADVTDSVHRHNDENPAPPAAAESVATDSVQRQNDGPVASLLERLDEFGKRLDMSLARRSENEAMIRELEKEVKEKCAIDSADVSSKKKKYGGSRTLRILGGRRSSISFDTICSWRSSVLMESMDSSVWRAGAKHLFWNEPVYPRPCCLRRLFPS